MRTQLKTAEATIQRLKDEAARTKVFVAQTRASCANEVRKRDRQIDGLKKAVTEAGRARGASKSPGITTITVVGDIGSGPDATGSSNVTSSDGYDLRMETNSFLAELAKSLSEENETVLGLLRKTTGQLKEMSGWDAVAGAPAAQDGENLATPLPASCAEMSVEIENILDHLRTILTNPSFVPIEEVVVREDEIHRLRDGWEKMETRWKEAVHLIDGWRRRMQVSGRPVNVEELKMGLRLSPVRVQNVEETAQGLLGLRLEAVPEDSEEQGTMHSPSPAERLRLASAEIDDAEISDCESSIFEDDVDVDDLDVEEPNIEILEQSVMIHSPPPLPTMPELTPLQDSRTAGNRGGVQPGQRKKVVDFATIVEENSWELKTEAPLAPPPSDKPQQSPKKKPTQPPRPVQQQDDAPPPTLADLSASASSIGSVQLVKTPSESATGKTSAPSSRGRVGRISPTGRRQETPSGPKVKPAGAPRSVVTRDRARPRSKKPESASKPSRSTSTTSSGSGPSPSNKSVDTMPLPNPAPTPARDRSPRRGNSRLPLPRSGGNLLPPPQQSPLSMATIAAKLAASERDADAARVRAKLKAARMGKKRVSLAPAASDTDASAAVDAARSTRSDGGLSAETAETAQETQSNGPKDEDEDELAPKAEELERPTVRKRERRTSRVVSRRRSTLSPWELGALIQGGVSMETE